MRGLVPSEGKISVVGTEAAGGSFTEDMGLEWYLSPNT